MSKWEGEMSKDVSSSSSWQKLENLAQNPYDLCSEDALLADGRMGSMICRSAGLKLIYSAQRVTEPVLDAFQEFVDEHQLVERFKGMKHGDVINRIVDWQSEDRQVLHTSCRDLFSEYPAEPESARQAREEMDKLKSFLVQIGEGSLTGSSGKPFTTMINIGIGGSDLGPRAIYEALKVFCLPGREVKFIANVDPDDAAEVLSSIDLEQTLVNVVSKSGTTLETLTNEEIVRRAFVDQGLDPRQHFVAVTGVGSPMDNPAHYLRSFYMFDYIGGRYSVTSMVGCVMLGFAVGFDNLTEFLRGAHEMDRVAESADVRENMPLLLAMLGIWNHNFLGYPCVAVLPYSQALNRFPAHLQQCDMESNGKSIATDGKAVQVKTGPVVWGEPGTNGQHAFYQLLHQGTEIVPVEFIGFQECQYNRDIIVEQTTSQQKLVANMLAQAVALAAGRDHLNPNRRFAGNRPSSIIFGNKLDPVAMGRLLSLYEAKIVFQGFSWNINSFDQEGVQLGKVLAMRFLALMRGDKNDALPLESELLRALEK